MQVGVLRDKAFLAELNRVLCITALWGWDLKCPCSISFAGTLRSLQDSSLKDRAVLQSVVPFSLWSLHWHLHLVVAWVRMLSTQSGERVYKAGIYCSHCAEGKFCSFSEFVSWSKALLCCPLIIIWAAKMSLVCLLGILVVLQADTIKVLLAVPLKQRFLQVQPPTLTFISVLGKWSKQMMAYSTITVKTTSFSAPAAMGVSEIANLMGISCSSRRQVVLDGLLCKVMIRKSFLVNLRVYVWNFMCCIQKVRPEKA